MATETTINQCLAMLRAQPFGNAPTTAADLRAVRALWVAFFGDMDDELLRAAVVDVVAAAGPLWPTIVEVRKAAAGPLWPTIVEVRKAAAGLLRQAGIALPADQAWAQIAALWED